jgi:hypothetical protein
MNVEIGTEAAQLPEKGIHKWDFPCRAQYDCPISPPSYSIKSGRPRVCAMPVVSIAQGGY